MKQRRLVIASVVLAVLFVVGGLFTLQLNAGSLFAPPPSPPPRPTGPLPPRLPTFDVQQLKTPPPPPTIVFAEPPTLAPLIIITPSPEWSTYRDPNLGFSFQYPGNWHIDAPKGLTPSDVASNGTYIIIDNYVTTGPTKGGVPETALKIDIAVLPGFAKYSNLDQWFSQYQQNLRDPNDPNSNPSFPDLQHVVINNVPALRWTSTGSIVALGKDNWLYNIIGYPATSKYISTFDRIVSSFQIP